MWQVKNGALRKIGAELVRSVSPKRKTIENKGDLEYMKLGIEIDFLFHVS